MRKTNACIRHQILDRRTHFFDIRYTWMNEIYLASALQLVSYSIPDHFAVRVRVETASGLVFEAYSDSEPRNSWSHARETEIPMTLTVVR